MFFGIVLLGAVIFLDVVLSGDNAVVIAMAVNELPAAQRDLGLTFGMLAAAVLRIVFALLAVYLLAYHIVALLGGFVLLWVAYKLGRDILAPADEKPAASATDTFLRAIVLIAAADLSMSLDNVLAVAALARTHPFIMAVGIALSILMLAFAARCVARLMERHKWLNWVGLGLILWVAFDLIAGSYDTTLALIRS